MITSQGDHVKAIQQLINETGLAEPLVVDGLFGPRTKAAVQALQAHFDLPVTGVVDHGLRAALRTWDIVPAQIRGTDLREAAYRLHVDYPAIAAIVTVESRGRGFLDSGRPSILFERHIMRRRLKQNGVSAEGHPADLVNPEPGGYLGGEREWERFDRAEQIHQDSAIESCSWGLFQIMGFHWLRLGYVSPQAFAEKMRRAESFHLDAFIRFVEADSILLDALRAHRWPAVARRYNGPAYAKNRYDERLRAEYEARARSS